MGLFGFLKKPSAPKQYVPISSDPYKDSATNLIYNLLFCDNPDLYKATLKLPYSYPFDILFSEKSRANDLQKIIDDPSADPRIKMLAYNRQVASGHKPTKKELLALWDETTEKINELWPQIPPHRFQEVDLAFGVYKAPLRFVIFYWIDNEIHHRGQGYVYLRSLGIEPPAFWDRQA